MSETGGAVSEAERLAEAAAEARRALPELQASGEEFAAHLASLRHDQPFDQWLSSLHTTDVYLAFACARGCVAAIAALEAQVLSKLKSFVARLKQPDAFVDDLGQLLREQLYLGSAPRLLDYSGRGSLANWMRVLSMRSAIDVMRKRTELLRDANEILEEAAETGGSDPELAFIRQRCRQYFVQALEAAVRSLSANERTLLRLHFLEGVTLDELAPLYQIHRTTVARRIASARQQIIEQGRGFLVDKLALSPGELESLMRLMGSRLELSLGGLLAQNK